MAILNIIISEPWDFINPFSNDNSIKIKLDNRTTILGKVVDVVSLVQPFMYKGNYLTTLILVPRYSNNPSDKTYNILRGNNKVETTNEDAAFLFIGTLE